MASLVSTQRRLFLVKKKEGLSAWSKDSLNVLDVFENSESSKDIVDRWRAVPFQS
jgi:hypothetical protein